MNSGGAKTAEESNLAGKFLLSQLKTRKRVDTNGGVAKVEKCPQQKLSQVLLLPQTQLNCFLCISTTL